MSFICRIPPHRKQWGSLRHLVQEVIHALLAEVEDRGCMEVLQDFAAPLPVLVIAQWLGLPQQDREFIRQLSRHLLALAL